MKKNIRSQKGFSLIELSVIVAITLLIFGFITINLVNFQRKTTVNSGIDTLTSEIRSQQTKAMSGKMDNGNGSEHGIYFQSDRYILFSGSSFSSTNPSNFTVMLDSGMSFTNITFPSSTIIFLQRSGEIKGFQDNSNTITLTEGQGLNEKTVTLNKYGVVISIN